MDLKGCVEVEHVADLEAGAVHENQVASDDVMSISRRRRRKHHFQFMRAGLHSRSKLHGEISMNDKLTLQTRRQAIALGQSRWQMRIVSAIPVMDVAIVVVIPLMAAFVIVTVGVPVVMAMTMFFAVVVAVLFVVTMAVALRHSDGGCERERDNGDCAGPYPELPRHCTPPQIKLLRDEARVSEAAYGEQVTVVQGYGHPVWFLRVIGVPAVVMDVAGNRPIVIGLTRGEFPQSL